MNTRRPFSRISCLALGTLLSATLPLSAQQPSPATAVAAPLPAYDVIAIHENRSGANMATVRWGDDAFVAENTTLTLLLLNAYDIRPDLISGLPAWASSVHFNVNAKISDADVGALKNLSPEQGRAMIAEILKERFNLSAHIETKSLPVYNLVVAKGGPKLKENDTLSASLDAAETSSGPHPENIWMSTTGITAVAVPISALAASLADHFQRGVIDKTGLTNRYDIHLKWRSDEQERAGIDADAPDIFTALQEQLGLKLVPSKGPVPTLVVDHVEMPTEN
ncbi:MAG TPA: TIGR03435 family protein [Acidobacteriaceae bacterium]